jgi:lysozyme
MNVRTQLISFEGWEHIAYPDPVTKGDPWTIGVGHTGPEVCEGLVWGSQLIDEALTADLTRATMECVEAFDWFLGLNEPRQAVLIGMCFQMGLGGLKGFHRMLAAARDERWATVAEEMRQSHWAKQTPERARRLAAQMETGEWS